MNHVTIKTKQGKKLTVLRSISVTNGALLEHCRQYGPGVYVASWPVQQNAGEGKPRIKREMSKDVFVYDDDCAEIPFSPPVPGERAGGVNVVMPRQDFEGLRSVMAETVERIVSPLSGLLGEMKTRLDALEAADDEEPEDDDDDEEEDPDFMAEILQSLRKPEYGELMAALFMPTPDEVKFEQIRGALEKNPGIASGVVIDILQVALRRFSV